MQLGTRAGNQLGARINSTCYIFGNQSGNLSDLIVSVLGSMAVPGEIICVMTLILAGIIVTALILSKCFRSTVLLLYFNITVTDAAMALTGVIIFLMPPDTAAKWFQIIALLLMVLR